MTYDKQALIELRDAVVAGKWFSGLAQISLGGVQRYHYTLDAYHGSLDAALSLLGQVLPDTYIYEMGNNSKTLGWTAVIVSAAGLYNTSHEGGKVGFLKSGGRALLIAILNALIDGRG